MSVFEHPAFDAHETVVFEHDEITGLSAIIAIHSTALGPAAGGCRMWTYPSSDAALFDVLRLAQGMSYKNAMAGLPLGGGKAVIIKPERLPDPDAFFASFGRLVDSFGGRYITAEDMGMSESIMEMIARQTRYVTGLPATGSGAGGDPSPKTALGVYTGIRAAVAHRFGDPNLAGKRVAIQGVGNVGHNLARLLHQAGATLLIADIDRQRAQTVAEECAAEVVDLQTILAADVDVLSPCATGAVLNASSIPTLRASIVAGGANNQLETPHDDERLREHGILYAPDFVINAGGIINVSCEYAGGFDSTDVDQKVLEIGPRLERLFERADSSGETVNSLAIAEARELIGRQST